jgi:hypothetical protein
MLKIDRMEFPKKYPIPNWLKLAIIVILFGSIVYYNNAEDRLLKKLVISDVVITGYSRVHAEVQYSIHNETRSDRNVRLLMKLYDVNDSLLTSAMFMVNLKAGEKKEMVKILDKLSHPLGKGEKPGSATLQVYKRKGLI